MADQRALVLGGVDPVDPWTALLGIAGACCPQHEHRRAAAPGVEDRHGRMHQPDIGMERDAHRLFGDFRIALRNGNRMFLMQADQHLRIAVAEVIDHAVMQAAIARARRQRNIAQVKAAQHLGHGVRRPAKLGIAFGDQPVLVVECGGCELDALVLVRRHILSLPSALYPRRGVSTGAGSLHWHELYGNGVRRGKRTLVIASQAKQSIFATVKGWIASSLRSSQRRSQSVSS